MRERFTYRGDSLWWFTELYLHKMRRLDARRVGDAGARSRAASSMAPHGLPSTRPTLVDARRRPRRFGRAHGCRSRRVGRDIERTAARWPSYLSASRRTLSRLRPSLPTPRPAPAVVAAFVHTAFWRAGADGRAAQESYIGPVLDAVAARLPRRRSGLRRRRAPPELPRAAVVGSRGRGRSAVHALVTPIERLAPRARARRRRSTCGGGAARWPSDVTSGDGIRAAGVFRGCDLWPVLRRELEAAALLQWPWSARAMDEAGAAIDALAPEVVLTYAEAGGWGRALVLEARRRGIPSVGVQHGFIYRHWLNYLHEPDEMAPSESDRGTADSRSDAGLRSLRVFTPCRAAGHFPPAALDGHGQRAARRTRGAVRRLPAGARRRFGASSASSPERPRRGPGGQALGNPPASCRAGRGRRAACRHVRLVIKVHPAETAERLRRRRSRTRRRRRSPRRSTDLARLLAAADLIVTMNSTVAVDGLVLGLPSLVVGLPNNLSPFVEAGVMAGADGAGPIRQALRALLYDREMREAPGGRGAATSLADSTCAPTGGRPSAPPTRCWR